MKYLSFFSGALGLDLGLEKAGFECLAVNEINPVCVKTIKANKPDLKVFDCDIRTLTPTQLKKELNFENLELIVGGPPCQSFSSAGKMRGLEDDRGNVSLHFVELICKLKPEFFILENVRGLLTAEIEEISPSLKKYTKHISLRTKGGVLKLFTALFKKAGYNLTYDLYDTSYFGVPQKRERVILIGSLTKKTINIPATHSPNKEDKLLKPISFKEACKGIKQHDFIKFDAWRYPFLKLVKEGGNWRSLPEAVQKEAMGKAFYSGGGKSGFYRRINSKEPTPTLTTSPRMPATMLCHPTELRPLSIQEYARVQTFPDSYKFIGSVTDIYKQIGNAVPVEFAYRIGKHLMELKYNEKYNPKIIKTSRYQVS